MERTQLVNTVTPDQARTLMRNGNLIVLAAFALVLAMAVGYHLLPGGDAAPAAGPLKPSTVGEFRGITLQLHSGHPDHPYDKYVNEIAATGANTISLVVAAYQEHCASTSIFIEARKSPSDQRLRELIALARKRGLRVILMPIVLLENPRNPQEWRGRISPTNWDKWWEDYGNYIMHYAHIAQAAEVDVLMIGSELVSTESHKARWQALIGRVREAYKGRIGYSANWDHYRPVKWWKDLDIIGMTSYHNLTGGKEPTLENLMAGWKPIKREILEWRERINRPIIFTEVGWPNLTTAGESPWNYCPGDRKVAPKVQADCFEAFFKTWIGEQAVTGILIWEWRSYPGQDTSPDTDTSYVPYNKPAMKVIRKYFQAPSARATSRPGGAAKAGKSPPAGSSRR